MVSPETMQQDGVMMSHCGKFNFIKCYHGSHKIESLGEITHVCFISSLVFYSSATRNVGQFILIGYAKPWKSCNVFAMFTPS